MNSIYLQGSETVHSAAGIMASAARELAHTMLNFQGSIDQLDRLLQNFLMEFRSEVDRMVKHEHDAPH